MSISTVVGNGENENKKIELLDDSTKKRDEEIEGMSLVSLEATEFTTEFTDPAILAAKPAVVRIRYSREELLRLRQAPLSLKRPDCLDPAYDIWQYDRKGSDTPSESSGRFEPEYKRRINDARERVRKEQEGIILSPQRRSFNSGCFVPIKELQNRNRSSSPLGKPESSHINAHREIPSGSRRIGSGRILTREVPWDYQDKSDIDGEYGYRRERRDTDRDDNSRYERRSYGRDIDKEKDKHNHRTSKFNDRRRISTESREEEPEWFSGGPSSQNDTIELRGFDDVESERNNKKKPSPNQKKKAKDRVISKNKELGVREKMEEKEEANIDKGLEARLTPALKDERNAVSTSDHSPSTLEPKTSEAKQENTENRVTMNVEHPVFDALEAILESKSIPSILTNGIGADGDASSGSRFSRFFKTESPPKPTALVDDTTSLQEEYLFKNILKDITETKVSIPNDSESSFAPISPAAYTGGQPSSQVQNATHQKPFNLFDILQRNRQIMQQEATLSVKNLGVPGGKVLSLEELESKMLQQGGGDPGAAKLSTTSQKQQHHQQQPLQQQKVEDDMTAFKRLLAQVSGGVAVTAANGPAQNKPPMSILEMLTHSQQQDELNRLAAQIGPASPNPLQATPPHVPNDLVLKLQQMQNHVQQQQQQQQQRFDMLNKLMNAGMHGQQLRAGQLQEMGLNQSRELLGRPEAQAILQGLKRGDITPQHLYQQLANPAMQPRHRELLLTIIKLHSGGGAGIGVGPSPRVLSPVPPPHALFQQQQQQSQQLRISPLPPNAMHQRIPSPRELQVHTQNIMQRALIKKKLEEQQENFKKRQEMQQRGQSPAGGVSPAKHNASPTPLAFTPTSVLRKMTAEKEEGGTKETNKNNETHGKNQPQQQQGRSFASMKASISQAQQQQQQQSPQQQQQQQQQQQTQQQQLLKQPAGRPIVKANTNFQPTTLQQQSHLSQQEPQHFFQHQQRMLNHHHQQQHRHKMTSNQFPQTGVSSISHYSNQHPFLSNPQPFQQSLTHQQLRAQHQQQQPSAQQQHQQYNNRPPPSASHQQQQMWHQQPIFSQQQNYDSRNTQIGRGGVSGGDLSPTSNQLARWFSSDLLERARAGKLPNMPNASLSQHAINLEELERQTAPPVHN